MQEFFTGIGQELLKVVLPIVATAVASALAAYLVQLARKAHLEVSAEQQAKFEMIIRRAIQWAEEYYAARRKAGVPVTPTMKLNGAIQKAQEELGPADKTREEIADAIHAQLAETPWGASQMCPAAPSAPTTAAP
jgi:hypothetical protein